MTTTTALSPTAEATLLQMLAITNICPPDRWRGRNYLACDIDAMTPAMIELEQAGLAIGTRCASGLRRVFFQATPAGMRRAGIPANRITEITT